MEHTFLLLAGDARLRCLRDLLHDRGENAVHLSVCRSPTALRAHIAAAETVILPVPVSRDGTYLFCGGEECMLLDDVLNALQQGQRVFGGGFSASQLAAVSAQGAAAIDFLKDASFVLRNAAFTAQGALRLLLEHIDVPLRRLPVLITGYGKVGSAAAALLQRTGCDITVAARSEAQRTEATLSGYSAVPIHALHRVLAQTSVIVNTVPAPVFSAAALQHCKAGTLFLELASAPFGADPAAVRAAGVHHIPGGGLPGRFCAAGCAAAMLPLLRLQEANGEVIP